MPSANCVSIFDAKIISFFFLLQFVVVVVVVVCFRGVPASNHSGLSTIIAVFRFYFFIYF